MVQRKSALSFPSVKMPDGALQDIAAVEATAAELALTQKNQPPVMDAQAIAQALILNARRSRREDITEQLQGGQKLTPELLAKRDTVKKQFERLQKLAGNSRQVLELFDRAFRVEEKEETYRTTIPGADPSRTSIEITRHSNMLKPLDDLAALVQANNLSVQIPSLWSPKGEVVAIQDKTALAELLVLLNEQGKELMEIMNAVRDTGVTARPFEALFGEVYTMLTSMREVIWHASKGHYGAAATIDAQDPVYTAVADELKVLSNMVYVSPILTSEMMMASGMYNAILQGFDELGISLPNQSSMASVVKYLLEYQNSKGDQLGIEPGMLRAVLVLADSNEQVREGFVDPTRKQNTLEAYGLDDAQYEFLSNLIQHGGGPSSDLQSITSGFLLLASILLSQRESFRLALTKESSKDHIKAVLGLDDAAYEHVLQQAKEALTPSPDIRSRLFLRPEQEKALIRLMEIMRDGIHIDANDLLFSGVAASFGLQTQKVGGLQAAMQPEPLTDAEQQLYDSWTRQINTDIQRAFERFSPDLAGLTSDNALRNRIFFDAMKSPLESYLEQIQDWEGKVVATRTHVGQTHTYATMVAAAHEMGHQVIFRKGRSLPLAESTSILTEEVLRLDKLDRIHAAIPAAQKALDAALDTLAGLGMDTGSRHTGDIGDCGIPMARQILQQWAQEPAALTAQGMTQAHAEALQAAYDQLYPLVYEEAAFLQAKLFIDTIHTQVEFGGWMMSEALEKSQHFVEPLMAAQYSLSDILLPYRTHLRHRQHNTTVAGLLTDGKLSQALGEQLREKLREAESQLPDERQALQQAVQESLQATLINAQQQGQQITEQDVQKIARELAKNIKNDPDFKTFLEGIEETRQQVRATIAASEAFSAAEAKGEDVGSLRDKADKVITSTQELLPDIISPALVSGWKDAVRTEKAMAEMEPRLLAMTSGGELERHLQTALQNLQQAGKASAVHRVRDALAEVGELKRLQAAGASTEERMGQASKTIAAIASSTARMYPNLEDLWREASKELDITGSSAQQLLFQAYVYAAGETDFREPLAQPGYAVPTLAAKGIMSLAELPNGRMDEAIFKKIGQAYMYLGANPTDVFGLPQIYEALAKFAVAGTNIPAPSFKEIIERGADAMQKDIARLNKLANAMGIKDIDRHRFTPPGVDTLPAVNPDKGGILEPWLGGKLPAAAANANAQANSTSKRIGT